MLKLDARRRFMAALSPLFAMAPVLLGIARTASRPDHDSKMVWMAFAATIGAVVVEIAFAARGGRQSGKAAIWAGLAAMIAAAITAMVRGATAPAGIWPVALVFGLCWTASIELRRQSRLGSVQ